MCFVQFISRSCSAVFYQFHRCRLSQFKLVLTGWPPVTKSALWVLAACLTMQTGLTQQHNLKSNAQFAELGSPLLPHSLSFHPSKAQEAWKLGRREGILLSFPLGGCTVTCLESPELCFSAPPCLPVSLFASVRFLCCYWQVQESAMSVCSILTADGSQAEWKRSLVFKHHGVSVCLLLWRWSHQLKGLPISA